MAGAAQKTAATAVAKPRLYKNVGFTSVPALEKYCWPTSDRSRGFV
jgi:hypothetical protein